MPTELLSVFYQRVFSRLKPCLPLTAMTRFFYDHPLAVGAQIELTKEMAKHIMVLRLSPGDPVTLFNGQGGEYNARLIELGRQRATVEILAHLPREIELPYRITLAQGLPEAGKMDWIIEKAVELGVHDIIPLAAQRSVVRLDSDRAEKRLSRWQSIIVSACQQCGRNRLLRITPPVRFDDYLCTISPKSVAVMFSPRATDSFTAWARKHTPEAITLLIGPEGGFSPEEETLARQNGITFLSMGPRILRTETAGIAAVSAINALWGAF